jgi:hypothetical protein
MKTCSKCKEEKPFSEFSKNKNSKDGLQSYCKICVKKIDKEYKEKNKNILKEKSKEYYQNNINSIKEYYQKNKEKFDQYQKQYYQENKKEQIQKSIKRNKENKQKYSLSLISWKEKNKEILREKRKIYMKQYRLNPNYKLRENIGHYIYRSLKEIGSLKNDTYKKYLGCSIEEYKQYLESLFTPEMNWENYGRNKYWEIDHIIPLSSFDLTLEEEQKKAFHYSNTQPMKIFDNRSKGGIK